MSIDAPTATETLTCHNCGHVIVTGKTLGKNDLLTAKCVKCNASSQLGRWRNSSKITPEKGTESPITVEKTKVDLTPSQRLVVWIYDNRTVLYTAAWLLLMVFIAVVAFPFLPYALSASVTGFAVWKVTTRWSDTVRQLLVAVAMVCSMISYRALVPRVEHWEKESVSYTDYRTGWTNKIYYRKYSINDGSYLNTAEGPMSASNKPHGQWKEFRFNDAGIVDRQVWYWYGKPVQEGEWHVLNK